MPRGRPPSHNKPLPPKKKEIELSKDEIKKIGEIKETVEAIKEEVKDDLVELTHWISNGCTSIGGTIYKVIDGKVKVKPEHVIEVTNHINVGR